MPDQLAHSTPGLVQPVYKSVTVGIPLEDAWRLFTEHPAEWWPEGHQVVPGQREAIVFEPQAGGRYYEQDSDGDVRVWGRILVWDPPRTLLMTWRINGRWQSIPDDERASEIEVTFTAHSDSCTEVRLGHINLHRHGDDAARIRAALDGPSPGETLANYAEAARAFATTR